MFWLSKVSSGGFKDSLVGVGWGFNGGGCAYICGAAKFGA